MLFEMATGNLSFRIEPQNNNDEIEELETVLNILAATMQNTFPKHGYVTPFYNYCPIQKWYELSVNNRKLD